MANFSSYASKFLNQSLLPNASVVSNDPLFYSITEGSREEVFDEDDPHLRQSRGNGQEYDPFNLEDIPDDEREDVAGLEETLGDAQDSLPLLLQSNWRQTQNQTQRRPQSPSPESSISESNDSLPLGLYMFDDDRPQPATLTESLLPRNANAPFVFSLPHPGRIPRRKFNDVAWATLWYICLGICAVGFIATLFLTSVSLTFPSVWSICSIKICLETIAVHNSYTYYTPRHFVYCGRSFNVLRAYSTASGRCQTRFDGHLSRSSSGYDHSCGMGVRRKLHLDRERRRVGRNHWVR
jgi:hypothetical protein